MLSEVGLEPTVSNAQAITLHASTHPQTGGPTKGPGDAISRVYQIPPLEGTPNESTILLMLVS